MLQTPTARNVQGEFTGQPVIIGTLFCLPVAECGQPVLAHQPSETHEH
jgi:hypothetical protein